MAEHDPHGIANAATLRTLAPWLHTTIAQDGEAKGFCPLCEDPKTSKSPSAGFNFKTKLWHCFKCDEGGRLAALVADVRAVNGHANVVDINTKQRDKRLPSEANINNWHRALLGSDALLRRFRLKRGLSLRYIKQKQIGYMHGPNRYVIPVRDAEGTLIACKGYKINARERQNKMIFMPEGNVSLYNTAVLEDNDDIVFVEGELDSDLLNDRKIPSVGHTAGAMGWQPGWAKFFKGKRVWLCPDEDDVGLKGALKAADSLRGVVAELYLIHLNTGKKGADATDFLVELGNSVSDFRLLMEQARSQPLHELPAPELPTTGKVVSLKDSQDAIPEIIELNVQVSGKTVPPYLLPKRITAKCGMDKGRVCKVCPMLRWGGSKDIYIPPNDTVLLDFIDASDSKTDIKLAEMIDARCVDRLSFTAVEHWPVEELYVSQSVEHRDPGETFTPLTRPMYSVSTFATDTNIIARSVAVNVPDPRTNRSVLMAWITEPVHSRIDDFQLTPELYDALKVFRPDAGQSPFDKCLEIADDLSHNVTRIYGRDLLHVGMDLVWHSALEFELLGQRVHKGWLEALVVGDTRTGKSEVARTLAHHYNSGVVRSCEGATFAGLVGGVQQIGKHWMVTWGLLPLNDRRLVVLDELSGLMGPNKNIIESMSSIRSEGIAQLTKISSQETSARVRTIWISNPVDGKKLDDSNGMAGMKRLITNPEDIARFDFAMAAANGEVPATLINTVKHEQVEHVYTSKLCEALVLWAWSRKPSQIVWAAGAQESIVYAALRMSKRYVSDPPLVQSENIRVKIARIAVAFAARTFSTTLRGEGLRVQTRHVEAAVDFLNSVYGSEAFGYLRASRVRNSEMRIAESHRRDIARFLRANPDVVESLHQIGDDKFRIQDFEGLESDPYTVLGKLRSWHMVRRAERGFWVKESTLIGVMRDLEDQQ